MTDTVQKALVAEDDRALADIIRLALQRAGYAVSIAHDGSKALRLAQSEQFDLIASDYQMPLLNGEQFLKSVRSGSPSQAAILVLCSAKAYELDSERLRDELDLAAVFYKPFSLNDLIQTVHEAVELQQSFAKSKQTACTSTLMPVQPVNVNCFLPASNQPISFN